MLSLPYAVELLAKFERYGKFPTDPAGIDRLAADLKKSADATGIRADLIVDKCAESSAFCPTLADFMGAAIEIQQAEEDKKRCDQVAAGTYDSLAGVPNRAQSHADWERQYGPPKPFNVGERAAALRTAAKGDEEQSRHKAMWAAIRRHLKLKSDEDWSAWPVCAKAARELGYADYADRWEASQVGSPKYGRQWRNL